MTRADHPRRRRPRPHASSAATTARWPCCWWCPCAADHPAVVDVRGPARRPLRPLRAGPARDVPVHRHVPGDQRDDAARALVAAPSSGCSRCRWASSTSCSATPSPSALLAAVQSALAVGRQRRPARPRRRRARSGCWSSSPSPTPSSARRSGCSSAPSRTTEFQAVQFMPAFVLPADPAVRALRRPATQLPAVLEAISNVLPLSYAVDAMQELVGAADTRASGATSRSCRLRAGCARAGRRHPQAPDTLTGSAGLTRCASPCGAGCVVGARRLAARLRPSALPSRPPDVARDGVHGGSGPGSAGLHLLRVTMRARWLRCRALDGPSGPPSALRLAITPAWCRSRRRRPGRLRDPAEQPRPRRATGPAYITVSMITSTIDAVASSAATRTTATTPATTVVAAAAPRASTMPPGRNRVPRR